MRFITLLLLLSLCSVKSIADVHPKDKASLHYRLIGFSFPSHEGANSYRLEVFEKAGNQLKKVITQTSDTNRMIATVPAFGKDYSWRVIYMKKKRKLDSTSTYTFHVLPNPYTDSKDYRTHIIDSAKQYKDLLVFFDNTRSLHNMKGEAVWFLPVIPGITDKSLGMIRDLKLTPDGTITVWTPQNVHELDYDGNILWSGPGEGIKGGDSTIQYHHEFTKMPDGTYMVIGNKMVQMKKEGNKNAAGQPPNDAKTPCGIIVQYNAQKEVIWTWNSCDYIKLGDPSTHFNSFYLDPKNKVFYTSYRNISRVVKAAYPSGKVLAHYGQGSTDAQVRGNGMFYSLHNVGINSDGNMHLFNNNFIMGSTDQKINEKRVSGIVIFKEPATANDSLVKLWEFNCDIDTFAQPIASGGGSLYELNNGDYLVCVGLAGRNFIVSKDKKVLWNVITEKREDTWKALPGYRISPVRQEDLKTLLFRP